jgi:ferric-dicitrate binding protein FerR (iron transport regulator)
MGYIKTHNLCSSQDCLLSVHAFLGFLSHGWGNSGIGSVYYMYLSKESMNRKNNYTHYRAEDFLKDSYFLAWMRNEDKRINSFWEQWQAEHPDKRESVKEAIDHYQALISFDKINHQKEEEREVWQRIEAGIERNRKKKIFRIRLLEWSAAAVVSILLGAGWLLHKETYIRKENFVIVQTGNEQKDLTLSDSSEIFLNSYTTLKYHPGNDREFWLDGQAFFDIKHLRTVENEAVPFVVHAGVENITVLGTSFTVKSIDSAARVVLINGKVKAVVGNISLVMKPGEKTEWDNGSFSKQQINPALYLAWKDGEYHFNHTSLKELAGLVKDYYGYDLVIKNEAALKTKTISGTVSSENEAVLWKTLEVMFHAKVEKKGKRMIMNIKNK